MKKLIFLLLFAFTLAAVSCKKEPVEPMKPTGVSQKHLIPTSFPVTVVFKQTTIAPCNTCCFYISRLSPTYDTILDLEKILPAFYNPTTGALIPGMLHSPTLYDSITFMVSPGDLIQLEAYKTVDEYTQSSGIVDPIYSVRTKIYVGGVVISDSTSNNLFMYHTF